MPECLPFAARAIFSESFREYPRLPCQHPQDVLHSKTGPRITGFPPKIIGLAVILSNNLFSSIETSSEGEEATVFLSDPFHSIRSPTLFLLEKSTSRPFPIAVLGK